MKDDLSVILTLVNGTLGLVCRKTEKSLYVTEIEMIKLLKNDFCEVLSFLLNDVYILNHRTNQFCSILLHRMKTLRNGISRIEIRAKFVLFCSNRKNEF